MSDLTLPKTQSLALPTDAELLEKMTALFRRQPIELVSRKDAGNSGTFAAEIVSCIVNKNQRHPLRCKYMTGAENNQEGGHRGGLRYEARVYKDVLSQLPLSLPHYYGSFDVQEAGLFCMILEYLPDSVRINESVSRENIVKAAAWIGKFHACFDTNQPSFLNRYNSSYYEHWIKNVENIAKELPPQYTWLQEACNFFRQHLPVLLDAPQTFIHGEFYPNNVLYQAGAVYPVDWESAAIGPGEIDLASISDGYSGELLQKIITAYVSARWGVPGDELIAHVGHRLSLAYLYLCLRWIGRYESLDVWKQNPKKSKKIEKWLDKTSKLFQTIAR